MNKRTNYLIAAAFFCLTTLAATAQSIKNEVQVIEGAYRIQKKQIIEHAMNLSGKEASDFWPIYEDYEDKRKVLGEERLVLIHDYVIAYPSLSDATASEIASRYFKNDEALARLHKKYYKKVKKALSPRRAAQLAQAEGFLQDVTRIQIDRQLPFIGDTFPIIDHINGR